jgi:hypothetical protein
VWKPSVTRSGFSTEAENNAFIENALGVSYDEASKAIAESISSNDSTALASVISTAATHNGITPSQMAQLSGVLLQTVMDDGGPGKNAIDMKTVLRIQETLSNF